MIWTLLLNIAVFNQYVQLFLTKNVYYIILVKGYNTRSNRNITWGCEIYKQHGLSIFYEQNVNKHRLKVLIICSLKMVFRGLSENEEIKVSNFLINNFQS